MSAGRPSQVVGKRDRSGKQIQKKQHLDVQCVPDDSEGDSMIQFSENLPNLPPLTQQCVLPIQCTQSSDTDARTRCYSKVHRYTLSGF
ncbi:hypothetical protein ABVT39_008236 [Epinephelus coioides]